MSLHNDDDVINVSVSVSVSVCCCCGTSIYIIHDCKRVLYVEASTGTVPVQQHECIIIIMHHYNASSAYVMYARTIYPDVRTDVLGTNN